MARTKKQQLPTEQIILSFDHCSVIYTAKTDANGMIRPKLYVQTLDQYRFQREFYVQKTSSYLPNEKREEIYWNCIIYQHPARREECRISEAVATKFILRFLDICNNCPSMLFNNAGDHVTDKTRPRHEGFVHLAEILHRGAALSVKLLN